MSPEVFPPPVAQAIGEQFSTFLSRFEAGGQVARINLLPATDQDLLEKANGSQVSVEADRCIHDEIVKQAKSTPDRIAVRCGDEEITYRELVARSEALADRLRRRGAGPSAIVGLCLDRGIDMAVAVLAIHISGAAYLPLDPSYPRERIAFMLADAAAPVLVTSAVVQRLTNLSAPHVVLVEDAGADNVERSSLGGAKQARSSDLAYVIYTSGSTGQPKGVMVTHRNVLNFFAGMDRRVGRIEGGTWLAVTSLSFDISVLEICWTLARGCTVAIHGGRSKASQEQQLNFSLFYFASDEGAERDKYRLLLEGAQFADREGFHAIWTPERHFHAFGGQFPNSAISSAAVAACTKRVRIRAGSSVVPLHHPLRLAEDWSMVDNISGGRVGVSFASGWQPQDFVLAPDRFERRKEIMIESVDTVRRLWRGEKLPFTTPTGKQVEIGTLPRPIQKELPIWLTAAGNPETFKQAGQLGCNLLTHLLGQKVEEVGEKIKQYREAWRAAGHPGQGQVTLMLHTFIGEDEASTREIVREPLKQYLRSSVDLIKQAAWTFPTFVQRAGGSGEGAAAMFDEKALSAEEMDALMDHAFSRYYGTSGLFGTPASCLPLIAKLRQIGIDEIACLIDFGIPTELALEALPRLKELMELVRSMAAPEHQASVPDNILAHKAAYLQCTPSMASMLVADAAGRTALSQLRALLVGGEAMPLSLARDLRAIVPGKLMNMYGPTETTIWSSTHDLSAVSDFVPLGDPIANTTFHVLTRDGRECPNFVPGELYIGGDGVTVGYHNRPELTAERFVPNPFSGRGRLYRTGDLVRRHSSGELEFLGRIDHQVKIRGHRIELGEIEAALGQQKGVKDCAVVAREDGLGDKRLVAYVTAVAGLTLDVAKIREELAGELPERHGASDHRRASGNALDAEWQARPQGASRAPRGELGRWAGAKQPGEHHRWHLVQVVGPIQRRHL